MHQMATNREFNFIDLPIHIQFFTHQILQLLQQGELVQCFKRVLYYFRRLHQLLTVW